MSEQPVVSNVSPGESFNMKDYLQFKRMITLQIIPVLYVVVAVIITLASIGMMFGGGRGYGGYGGYGALGFFQGGFLSGLVFLVIGNVFWRMWCEFMLVVFRINKSLQNIDKNTQKQL